MTDKKVSIRSNMAFSTILVMLGLLFTKGSGFLRDIFVSMKFSDDIYRDSFTLAFTIPDLFYNLLVGGAIFSSVAPYMSGALAVNEEKRGIRTVSIFISVISVVMAIICTFGTIFSKQLYSIYALKGGVDQQTLDLASEASRMLFPQIFFIMLAALCIGILNSYKRFSSTAFGPTIYNICVFASIYLFAGNTPNKLVLTTGGILVSSVIYFIYQYSIGFDKLKQIRFIFKPRDPDFIFLFKRAIPIMIASSITQINVVVSNYFAGQFDKGSIYGFRNASTIWQIPYGIFTVAMSTVMTPIMAGYYESKQYDEASKILSSKLKSTLFMMIPSAAFVALMSTDVVKAIYQWSSNYTEKNAKTAAVFLIGFSTAIITTSVINIVNHAFYAIGKTKVPLLSGTIGLFVNPILCSILIMLGVGPISLSIAYSATSLIQMSLLLILYCRNKELAPKKMVKTIFKCFGATAVMALVLFAFDRILPATGGKMVQLGIICAKAAVSVFIYFGMCMLLKMEEATYWIGRFKSKLMKKA